MKKENIEAEDTMMTATMHKLSRRASPSLPRFPFTPQQQHLPILFPKTRWLYKEKYRVSLAKQGSKEWLDDRKGQIPVHFFSGIDLLKTDTVNARVTGSKYGAAAGQSPFTTPEDLAMEIAGLKKSVFSEEAKKRMDHGTNEEPNARRWYEKKYGVVVEEIGLVVPTWDFHLGASVDGVVKDQDGIIEIKCPAKMYQPLRNHMTLRATGWKPKMYYHAHIWPSHYDQMQGGMAILDKKWCDYIVYSTSEKQVYCERVLFNQNYWDGYLYPALQAFLKTNLFPILEDLLQKY